MKNLIISSLILIITSIANASDVSLRCVFDSEILPLPFTVITNNSKATITTNTEDEVSVECIIENSSESRYRILCEDVGAGQYEEHDAWVIKLLPEEKNGTFTFRAKDKNRQSAVYPFTCD